MAADLGLSSSELRDMAKRGPGASDELHMLLAALGIDLHRAADLELTTVRDMQRLCGQCVSKKQCARELAAGSAAESYHQFCPNALTVDALLVELSSPAGG
jgi:hypothetical protein